MQNRFEEHSEKNIRQAYHFAKNIIRTLINAISLFIEFKSHKEGGRITNTNVHLSLYNLFWCAKKVEKIIIKTQILYYSDTHNML